MSEHTAQQIKYAHSLIQAMADHLDQPVADCKVDSKREWGVVVISNSVITGDRSARLLSFKDYTREQMNGYLYGLEVWLSENNIPYIPPEHE